jgi:hypothetical protein
MARLTDLAFVQRVRAAAAVLLEQDPALEDPASGELAAALTELSANAGEAN